MVPLDQVDQHAAKVPLRNDLFKRSGEHAPPSGPRAGADPLALIVGGSERGEAKIEGRRINDF